MKIFFVSLGCDKNLVDTEMMLGELVDAGHAIVDDENLADIAVINTCSFIHDAKEESINTIIELGELKEKGQLKAVIVCGCLAQRYADQIRTELPEVDVIVGTMAIDEIVAAVAKVEAGEKAEFLKPVDGHLVYGKRRVVTTGGHYAYLKIAEGCDKHCTYCAIPKMRGTYRSVPMDVLVKEARELASQGVKELILVAQETTLYGTDLYHEKSLPKLLRALSGIEELYYIRILYCYPEEITDELIDEISYNKKVIKYLDIPIQSGADRVLKRMGRRTTRVELETLIGKLRAKVPDICLRTTLISGFPGERGRDFKETYEFVKRMRFDRLGVFTYSREEDTAAARMSGHLPEFIKNRRKNKIMKLQQTIAFDKAREEVGKTMTVFAEGKMPEDGVYVCRTYKDAPGVDGYLFLETEKDLMTGDLIRARVTDAREYDLVGVPEDELT
ncbi:MAG: 30S ribosomal protein S12 methylthiotransferase RimO [Lachnospiraceae bacterium]|nr:30S ribosomal protein S12 methylthiotransferase RimO [Lachnospiraceae bacterium]